MDKLVRKTYETETKAAADDRVLTVRISTVNPDRSKDVVVPKGAILNNYKRNPVVAVGHNYSGLAVAKAEDIQITDDAIFATVKFPKKGVYDLADTVYELYKDGFMSAWSIGFMPVDYEERKEGGYQFKSWELLEFSAVLVPDNPEALTVARSKGIDTTPVEKLLEDKSKKKKKKVKKAKKEETVTIPKKEYDDLVAKSQEKETTPEPAKDELPKELDLVEALKVADKVIGVALRNYKQSRTGQ